MSAHAPFLLLDSYTGPSTDARLSICSVAFTYALRDRLAKAGSKVKALVAHPGLAATNLQVTTAKDGGMGETFSSILMGNMSQSAEDGTVPLLVCACMPEWEGRAVCSGDFYGPPMIAGKPVLLKEEVLADQEARDLLWDLSMQATGAGFPY